MANAPRPWIFERRISNGIPSVLSVLRSGARLTPGREALGARVVLVARMSLARFWTGAKDAVDTYLAATDHERSALWNVLSPVEQANLRQYLARLLQAAERSLAESGTARAKRSRRASR